jgi:hypothetical protein
MSMRCRRLVLAIFIVLLMCGISTMSASGSDGFLGIPWGSSREEVAKVMAERHFPKDNSSTFEAEKREIYVGTFAAERAYLNFIYTNNKLVEASANFIEVNSGATVPRITMSTTDGYNAMADYWFTRFEGLLIEKLGQPTMRYPGNNEPWQPREAIWRMGDSDNRISVTLYKEHAYRDRDNDLNSCVFISYRNDSLAEKENGHSTTHDL